MEQASMLTLLASTIRELVAVWRQSPPITSDHRLLTGVPARPPRGVIPGRLVDFPFTITPPVIVLINLFLMH